MTIRRLLAVSAMVTILAGCYTMPPPVYLLQAPPEEVVVPPPPPDPRADVRPAPPDESYVWQEGYWNWDGTQYSWAPGQWVEPPQPGYIFVPAYYAFEGGTWRYRRPYWCHPSRAPRDHRKPRSAVAAAPTSRQPADPPGTVRIQAPDVITPSSTRVRAPDASEPDALPSKGHAIAPPAPGRVAVPPEAKEPHERTTIVLRESEPAALPDPDSSEPVTDLSDRVEYRGTRAGRPVFGDDPTSERPRVAYPTDRTGAIVLGGSGRVPRRGVVVVDRDTSSRAVDLQPAPADRGHLARPLPEARVAPPPRPEPPAMRPSAPVHMPAPSVYSPPPARVYSPPPSAPVYSPPPRVYSPPPSAPVYSPPARVYSPPPMAPVYRAPMSSPRMSAPTVQAAPAPAPVRAPAHVAPSGGRRR